MGDASTELARTTGQTPHNTDPHNPRKYKKGGGPGQVTALLITTGSGLLSHAAKAALKAAAATVKGSTETTAKVFISGKQEERASPRRTDAPAEVLVQRRLNRPQAFIRQPKTHKHGSHTPCLHWKGKILNPLKYNRTPGLQVQNTILSRNHIAQHHNFDQGEQTNPLRIPVVNLQLNTQPRQATWGYPGKLQVT